jgi:hypothetical protein
MGVTGNWAIQGEQYEGWISPQGKFYWCGFGQHSNWMTELGKNEEECLKRGWKRFQSSQTPYAVIHGGPKDLTNSQATLVIDWAKKFGKRVKIMDWAGSLKFEWFV